MDKELTSLTDRMGNKTKAAGTRYCCLPYIEGQKYTFGSYYHECGECEEFVFLPQKCGSNPLPPSFHISCSKGAYTLNRSRTNPGVVFIDQRPVKKAAVLEVGATILVHYPKYHPKTRKQKLSRRLSSTFVKTREERQTGCELCYWDDCESIEFVFRDAELPRSPPPPSSVTEVCGAVSEALENSLILCKIFGFLHLPDVKSTRLVCAAWNAESIQLLKCRTFVSFPIINYNSPLGSTVFFRYLQDMKGFGGHPSWVVELNCDKEHYVIELNKIWNDFNTFLTSPNLMSGQIRKLRITLPRSRVPHFPSKLLNSRVCEGIEELWIDIKFPSWQSHYCMLIPVPIFHELLCLRSLTVNFDSHYFSYERHRSHHEDECRTLMKFLLFSSRRTLTALSMMSPSPGYNCCFLPEIKSAVSNDFPKIMEIRILVIDAKGLGLLLKIRENSLRKIEFNGFEDSCTVQDLNRLIVRHADFLEELVLENLPNSWETHYICPKLPYLKNSKIVFQQR